MDLITTTEPLTLSLRDLSHRWRVGRRKLLTWIKRGELLAVNVSDSPLKPQWRVTSQAVEQFETRRSSTPLPRPSRRRQTQDKDYFPEL